MPGHSYLVLGAFTFLLLVFVLQIIRLRNSGSEFLGTPTIEKRYFYSGKTAIFSTWALFIVKALNPMLGFIYLPDLLSWTAAGILCCGILILAISFFNLGKALKVGLPGQETSLQTHGLYRLSRNPLYVGVYIISVASCIYFPDLINIFFTIYGIYIHHMIIRQEERFLAGRFGADWLVYSARVRRYL
jgi:protein-S-isoprenylcysteine O-methyltransferase Ste14